MKRLTALQRTAHWHTEDEAAELEHLLLNAYHFAFTDRPEHVRTVLKRLVKLLLVAGLNRHGTARERRGQVERGSGE